MEKEIVFGYKGGREELKLNVNPLALPITFEICDNPKWVMLKVENNILTVDAAQTYDYRPRECRIELTNAFGTKLTAMVRQEGFEGIDLQCDKMAVLHHSYFDVSPSYNFYVTVYGGNTQELVCKKLKEYITKVWDNSDMYNDFIIKIPRGLSGTYTIKHSEYSNYKKYCKENGIRFDESKVKREIEIVQITEADNIGDMVLEYDGTRYGIGEVVPVTIKYGEQSEIDVISTRYMHQISYTKYEVIDTKQVSCEKTPDWINVWYGEGKIILAAPFKNNFSDRTFRMRVTNKTNSHQYIVVEVKQKSGT